MTLLRIFFCVLILLFAVISRSFYNYISSLSTSSYSDDDDVIRGANIEQLIIPLSRVYRNVNTNNRNQSDPLIWGNESNYIIGEKIGSGKYSNVYIGTERSTGKQYAVKVLKPAAPTRILREIRVMRALAGCPNIATLREIFKDAKGRVSIVQDLAEGSSCKTLLRSGKIGTTNETKHVARKILEALDCAHSRGIIHRDVKPHNVVYDSETGTVNLIDWGLAEFYFPGQRYNVSVATNAYKPPELLVGMHYYDYSLDMWSFGCVFAEMLFGRKEPLFRGRKKCAIIRSIGKNTGSKDILDYVDKYNLTVPCKYKLHDFESMSFCNGGSCKNIDHNALDLLKKLIVVDHNKRISAAEALQHPYFL